MDRRITRPLAFLEILSFYLLALFLIWGSGVWRPPVLLAGAVMAGICFLSNRFHGDTLERIGLASDQLRPAFKLFSLISAPFILVLIVLAWGKPFPDGWGGWFAILGYPVWGFLQEYALLGFMANRLEDLIPRHPLTVAGLNGLLFASLHLPNPILMPATFISGSAFTWVFLRRRHLLPPALYHALAGILLSLITGHTDGLMSVGPAYIRRIGGWF